MSMLNKIQRHLNDCSASFVPNLNSYVDIVEYSKKLDKHAVLFTEFDNDTLIGLVAAYDNSENKFGWITNVSVHPNYSRKGIASKLLIECIEYFKNKNYTSIFLEVYSSNQSAISLYKKHNFTIHKTEEYKMTMQHQLTRNYDLELNDTLDHKYAYNFDFDIMHHYYMKSALPFINVNNTCLELGSSKGHFTKRLAKHYNDITCIEASKSAINYAKTYLNDEIQIKNINFIHDVFENVKLNSKFDTVFLTHVLEHIQDPISLLAKINNEWLSDSGTLILICPNANAPSRQIAVKMRLISHNSAITDAEKKHGHYITYTLDTLERDAAAAGLNIVCRTGIFFKAFANFQWDRLLETDIISNEYLEGCYQLGQQYPDLCSSIMLVCKKG
jgi:ribosomal protein S18 acetylase RimI-like enzyme/protein-L-isoaspartate O-methyltransferase